MRSDPDALLRTASAARARDPFRSRLAVDARAVDQAGGARWFEKIDVYRPPSSVTTDSMRSPRTTIADRAVPRRDASTSSRPGSASRRSRLDNRKRSADGRRLHLSLCSLPIVPVHRLQRLNWRLPHARLARRSPLRPLPPKQVLLARRRVVQLTIPAETLRGTEHVTDPSVDRDDRPYPWPFAAPSPFAVADVAPPTIGRLSCFYVVVSVTPATIVGCTNSPPRSRRRTRSRVVARDPPGCRSSQRARVRLTHSSPREPLESLTDLAQRAVFERVADRRRPTASRIAI